MSNFAKNVAEQFLTQGTWKKSPRKSQALQGIVIVTEDRLLYYFINDNLQNCHRYYKPIFIVLSAFPPCCAQISHVTSFSTPI